MSFAHMSGPVRVGTVRTGAVTAMNSGLVELVQTATIPFTAILASPAAVNLFTLPAGAKITDFLIEVTVAITTATNCGITIGKVGGTANFFMTTLNTTASVVRVPPTTVAAAMVANQCNNIGTSDVTLTATPTAAGADAAAGSIVVSVRYVQRDLNGSASPII